MAIKMSISVGEEHPNHAAVVVAWIVAKQILITKKGSGGRPDGGGRVPFICSIGYMLCLLLSFF